MIGCFNINGHDCNQSDLDTIFFVPRDVLEDAEVRRRIGHEALIYDPFAYSDDEETPEDEEMSLEEAVNDNSTMAFEEADIDLQETIYGSLLLGADYDYDDGLGEDPLEWLQRRYADVIRLNDELGYQQRPSAEVIPLFTTTYIGRGGHGRRKLHWSDKRCLREASLTYDKRRGKAHAK